MSEQSLATRSNNVLAIADPKAIQEMARSFVPILRQMITNGKKLTDEQIEGRAMFAALEGLNPVTEVQTLVDSTGKTLGHMMGINGYRRKCMEQLDPGDEVSLEFVELEGPHLPKGAAYSYECRLRDGTSYRKWQKRLVEVGKSIRDAMGVTALDYKTIIDICGPAPVFTGIGIFWANEFNDYKDRNFPPQERAKKRAERNARTKRFPTTPPAVELSTESDAPFIVANDNAIEGQFSETPKPARTVDQLTGEIMNDPAPKPATVDVPEQSAEPETLPEAPQTSALTQPEAPAPASTKDAPKAVETPKMAKTHDFHALRYEPEALKARIAEMAKTMTGPANGKRGAVLGMLEELLSYTPEPSESRHMLLKYLTGHTSSKDIPDNVILAMHAWLNPSKDAGGAYIVNEMSAREALAAFNFCQPPQNGLF